MLNNGKKVSIFFHRRKINTKPLDLHEKLEYPDWSHTVIEADIFKGNGKRYEISGSSSKHVSKRCLNMYLKYS